MTYVINHRGDACLMVLTDDQVVLMNWLDEQELLPDDFEYKKLEELENYDLTKERSEN